MFPLSLPPCVIHLNSNMFTFCLPVNACYLGSWEIIRPGHWTKPLISHSSYTPSKDTNQLQINYSCLQNKRGDGRVKHIPSEACLFQSQALFLTFHPVTPHLQQSFKLPLWTHVWLFWIKLWYVNLLVGWGRYTCRRRGTTLVSSPHRTSWWASSMARIRVVPGIICWGQISRRQGDFLP